MMLLLREAASPDILAALTKPLPRTAAIPMAKCISGVDDQNEASRTAGPRRGNQSYESARHPCFYRRFIQPLHPAAEIFHLYEANMRISTALEDPLTGFDGPGVYSDGGSPECPLCKVKRRGG